MRDTPISKGVVMGWDQPDNAGAEQEELPPSIYAQVFYGCAVMLSVFLLLVGVLALEYTP